MINSIRGAVASAVGGRGVALFFSYQVADRVRNGELEIVLAGHEPAALPVHVIVPQGRLVGAEGARLHGFRGAAAAQPLCAAGER